MDEVQGEEAEDVYEVQDEEEAEDLDEANGEEKAEDDVDEAEGEDIPKNWKVCFVHLLYVLPAELSYKSLYCNWRALQSNIMDCF